MEKSGSKSLRDKLSKTLQDVPRSGIRDFFEIVSTRKDIISLGIGEPDFDSPWHVREASIFALERGGAATCYTSNLGLLKLRRALAKYVKATFDAVYDPETEILITVGVSEAMDLAIRALVEPGDEVLYHEPGFVSYAPVITFAHGKPVVVKTRREDNFTLKREALEECVTDHTKALILSYPNNPTGAALSRTEAEDVADFVRKHDLVLITDEIYAELTYDGQHVSMASLPGMKERTVFLHGFSKAWAMTGFRMGYACAPEELTEAMMKIHQYTMMCAPTPSQEAALEALTNPVVDIDEMRNDYRKRRNFMCSAFAEMGLPCVEPRGAFYTFPYIGDLGLTSRDFSMQLLDEENVACVPGSAFGECGEGYVRCAFAASLDDIKEAMKRMARFVARKRS